MTTLTDDFLSSKDESSYCIYVPNMKIHKELNVMEYDG